jgi:exonuclease V gamma subunit
LKYIVAAFLEGQRRPLPLFMRASPVFIRQEGDMAKAEAAYDGNDYARGDRDDPWHELVWPGQYPLGEDFELWSGRIYGPLKDYLPS